MISRKKTFGESLSHFVRSIDIVDASTKNRLLGLIEDYLKDELDIYYFNFYVECSINQEVGLRPTDWYRGGLDRDAFTIKEESEKDGGESGYQCQVSVAYDKESLVWIVAPDGIPLRLSEEYVDLVANASPAEIPKYVKRTDAEILTSIIRPVKDDNRTYGIVNFESTRYLEYSSSIASELSEISELISTLFLLNKAYESQKRNTEHEIDYLADLKNDREGLLHISKPKIFIASSDKAERDVISLILNVLDEYSEKVGVVYWKNITESGLIAQQVLREIRRCQYGICYLSEPVNVEAVEGKTEQDKANEGKTEYRYQDNENVLIEAGMLSALSHDSDFDNWIPIREADSRSLPFDFAPNRTLIVTRFSDNKLDVDGLTSQLKRFLENWPEFSD